MSSGPLRGGKGGPKYEGHMREPTITWWPGTIKPGTVTEEIGVTTDLFPSFARLSNAEAPRDRKLDGRDILDILLGKPGAKSPHEFLYYETEAVRQGPWKIVLNKRKKFELYNLNDDLGERVNLAKQYPEKFRALKDRLKKHAEAIQLETRPAGFVNKDAAKPLISEPGDLPRLREFK